MTEYTAEMAHAAVARGAAWLDEKCPEWYREVNLDRLNLASPTFCILGQTARCLLGQKPNGHAMRDGFGAVLATLYRSVHATPGAWSGAHGFQIPPEHYDEADAVYEMLDIAWRELIRERLEPAP